MVSIVDCTLYEALKNTLPVKTVTLKRNSTFVLTYGPEDVLWGIDEGVIITEKNNSNGSLLGTGIYSKGMFIGVTAFNNDEGIITCRAIKRSTLTRFKTKEVVELLKRRPDLMLLMLKFLADRFRFFVNFLEMNSLHSTDERVEYFEKMLSQFNDTDILNISDTIIAEYLGMHPISVSRARKHILEKRKMKKSK